MPNLISSLTNTLTSGINAVQKGIVDTQTQLASGTKILNAAEVGIVTRLSAQATGYKSVTQNIAAGMNVINVGNTALSSISSILSQAKDIATQAANAGLQTSDRAALNTTFLQLKAQVTNLITNAGVNGENVLAPTGSNLTVQSGITGGASSQTTITNLAITLTTLGINASTVDTQTNAQAAIDTLTDALADVSGFQSTLAATKTGLESSAAAALSLSTNLQSTIDSIQNVDQTALQAKLQQLNNQQAIDYYLISQMNTAAASALTIFR
jgi:flagellin-like hook-associated protein FlgL